MSVVLVKFGEIVFGILLKLDLQKTISYLFSTNSYKDNSSVIDLLQTSEMIGFQTEF